MNHDPKSYPSVGALVVTWNRCEDVLECIDSILGTKYPRLSVYVVDNASSDGTADAIASRFPDVQLIRSTENLGFAAGNNAGLERLMADKPDAVFLINDDVVIAPDSLEQLITGGFMQPDVGAVAPKVLLYSQTDVIWSAGGVIDPRTGIAVQRRYGEPDGTIVEQVDEIDYAVGCAVLMKTDAIRLAGMLDPRYFTYYEETDWCRRIRDCGHRILYVPTSRVLHKVTMETNGRNNASYYYSRNRLLYLRSAGMNSGRIAWIALTDMLRSAIVHGLKGRREQSRLIFRGVKDFYLNRFGKMRC